MADKEQYYVLLDEIQYVADFTDVLNGLLHMENVDAYVTGSNSRFLSSDILTEFRGRGDEVRVYPLSFAEFRSVYEGSADEAWDAYLVYGGMPRITFLRTEEQKMAYLTNLFEETYIRDIVERNQIRNTADLEELVNILASSVGSLTNAAKLEHTFRSVKKSGITAKTIKSHIDCLREAFLIDRAYRYDIKGKKYINTPVKYYFTDTGLRNARLSFRQIEETHLMENILFNELKVRGYSVDVGVVELREEADGKRCRVQTEIGFVANKGSRRYYLQSAFSLSDPEKQKQELRPLLHVNDSFQKLVIVGGGMKPRRDEHGITYMGIRTFLLDENSLEK